MFNFGDDYVNLLSYPPTTSI